MGETLTVWGNWRLTTLQRSSCCIVHLRRIFYFFFPHEKYCLKNVPRWPLLNPCKHIRNPLKLSRRANNHYWGSDHIPSYSLQAIKTSGFLTPEIWLHACLEMRTDLLRQNPQIPLAQINLRHHTQKTTHKWEKKSPVLYMHVTVVSNTEVQSHMILKWGKCSMELKCH